MAAAAVWGIDVGQCALKAIKLRPTDEGKVEIVAFDLIEHPKILSQPDAEPDELIKAALEKFASRNDWQGDQFVVGVPGQQTFARFCKLPPVDAKRIPDIVKFEASQQIPFEIDEVVWDYEVFQEADSPDIEVGIFAMRKDLIRKQLDYFAELNVAPQAIQAIPSALYNFCRFDQQAEIEQGAATVIIDVGAQNTDLIIVEPSSAWTRNIPLGGNNFTEALVKAFKLSFAKAESLKRTAATSKYARQIFQAMRPVFAELVAEVQRSLGFYASTHRETELKKVLACGNAFRLPGLQKYLENNLTITGGVKKLEKFNAVLESATINAPQFTDNILSFGSAYGLALQGIGLATIRANLLPPDLARAAEWKKKRPFFAAAAACTAVAAIMPWTRMHLDGQALAGQAALGDQAARIIEQAQELNEQYDKVAGSNEAEKQTLEQLFELPAQRDLVPRIISFVHSALPEVDPALAAVQSPEQLKELLKKNPGRYARTNRREILIESLELAYAPDIDKTDRRSASMDTSRRSFGPAGGMRGGSRGGRMAGGGMTPSGGMRPGGMRPGGDRDGRDRGAAPSGPAAESDSAPGFYIVMTGKILYGETRDVTSTLIFEDFYPRLLQMSRTPGLGFYVPQEDPKATDERNLDRNIQFLNAYPQVAPNQLNPAAEEGESEEEIVIYPDPVTGEEMITDWAFELGFKIKLGEPPEEKSEDDQEGDD